MTFFVEGLSDHQKVETKVRRIGEYNTVEEAIAIAKQTIDDFLKRTYRPGMLSKVLYLQYQQRGEYPFIFRDDDKTFNVPSFNHINYAQTRCTEICGAKK
jgi:hypothetical protein